MKALFYKWHKVIRISHCNFHCEMSSHKSILIGNVIKNLKALGKEGVIPSQCRKKTIISYSQYKLHTF